MTQETIPQTLMSNSQQHLEVIHKQPVWIKSPYQLAIFNASSDKKIANFEFTNEYARLNDFMEWWRQQLGITTTANHKEPTMNLTHIQELYSDLSIEDLKLAVKYSLSGILNVDFIAYNSFSPLYISKILNAYKEYRDDQLNIIAREKMKFDQEQNKPKELTPEQKEFENLKSLNYFRDEILNGNEFTVPNPIINKMIDITKVTWDLLDLKERATKLISSGKTLTPFQMTSFLSESENEIEKIMKTIALREYFKTNEVDFTKL